jgi:hypothetical protein
MNTCKKIYNMILYDMYEPNLNFCNNFVEGELEIICNLRTLADKCTQGARQAITRPLAEEK